MKKVGIIGCGNIAQVHAWVLKGMENVEVTAFCDIQEEKARALSEKYTEGKGCVVTDWRELCSMDLDVVHICTPHYLHAPMAIELLQRGKSVFMEKPCAISVDQFEALKETVKACDGKLGFCFQNRYNETTRRMEKLVEERAIGKLLGARAFVTWRRDEDYYEGSEWKGKLATEGGGALMNQSIHTLDLLLKFLGEPMQVEASVRNHHLKDCIEVEDTVEAWLSFEDNKRACFYASNGYMTDAPVMLELQGEKGRITMNGPEVTLWTEKDGYQYFECEKKTGIGKGYWGCGHEACIKEFYNCMGREKTFPLDIEGVENTFYTMMKIYERGGKSWNR